MTQRTSLGHKPSPASASFGVGIVQQQIMTCPYIAPSVCIEEKEAMTLVISLPLVLGRI